MQVRGNKMANRQKTNENKEEQSYVIVGVL